MTIPVTTKPLMKEWDSLTYEEQREDYWIVSFPVRLSKKEVESHVPICYYAPPNWDSWEGKSKSIPNPTRRWDGNYVWFLKRK